MKRYNSYRYFIVFFITLISIEFWSFNLFSNRIYGALELISILILIAITLDASLKNKKIGGIFKNNIFLFIALPFISSIGAFLYHDQSFWLSFYTLRYTFLWLLYYVLHIYNIPIKKILNILVIIGIGWAFLNIIQQLTYPYYWFSSREDTYETSIFRAGVYRFMPYRHHYGYFILLFFFNRFLKFGNIKFLYFTLFALCGFYFFGTRQFLAVAILSIGFMILFHKSGRQSLALFSFFLFVSIGIYFQDQIFGKFIQLSKEEINEDNIRLFSLDFYLNQYWPKEWFARVIGNGKNHLEIGKYAKEILYYNQELKLYRSDVGIIGTYNIYGLLYVVNILWYNIKGLNNKYYLSNNKYIQLVFISSLLLLPLTVYYDHSSAIPFYCLITYLVEKGYSEKRYIK